MSIQLRNKGIIFENILIKPFENVKEVMTVIESRMEARGDPIDLWGEFTVILLGPLAGEVQPMEVDQEQ